MRRAVTRFVRPRRLALAVEAASPSNPRFLFRRALYKRRCRGVRAVRMTISCFAGICKLTVDVEIGRLTGVRHRTHKVQEEVATKQLLGVVTRRRFL